MSDRAHAVRVRFVDREAEAVACDVYLRPGPAREALLGDHARAIEFAAPEQHREEARHCVAAGAERAGWRVVDHLERLRVARSDLITARHQRGERRRQRLHERRALHPERREDLLRDVLLERHARGALDDVPRQCDAVVRVRGRALGHAHAARQVPAREFRERNRRRVRVAEIAQALVEAGAMREQLPQRGGLAERFGHGEIEVRVHVRVEVELALLDELHHGERSEQLADRRGTKERARIYRDALLDVREAVALHQNRRAVRDHDHDRARDVAPREFAQGDRVHERLDVRCSRRRPCARGDRREQRDRERTHRSASRESIHARILRGRPTRCQSLHHARPSR